MIFVATKKDLTIIFFTPLFCCCIWILDPRSGIRDPGWIKIRIRDKHPGSATLVSIYNFVVYSKIPWCFPLNSEIRLRYLLYGFNNKEDSLRFFVIFLMILPEGLTDVGRAYGGLEAF